MLDPLDSIIMPFWMRASTPPARFIISNLHVEINNERLRHGLNTEICSIIPAAYAGESIDFKGYPRRRFSFFILFWNLSATQRPLC